MKSLFALALLSTSVFALDLPPPPAPVEWPMSRVHCINIDFDPADAQPSTQSCTQVWFNDSEKCYYNATVIQDAGVWRVMSKAIVRFQYTPDSLRCTPDTGPVPPPAATVRSKR